MISNLQRKVFFREQYANPQLRAVVSSKKVLSFEEQPWDDIISLYEEKNTIEVKFIDVALSGMEHTI